MGPELKPYLVQQRRVRVRHERIECLVAEGAHPPVVGVRMRVGVRVRVRVRERVRGRG